MGKIGGYLMSVDDMLYCQSCGREVAQGFEYCPFCGSALSQPSNQPVPSMATSTPPRKSGTSMRIITIIIVAVFAIAIIILFLLVALDEDDNNEENNGLLDVEISISTDKTTYTTQENATVTITVDNRMDRDFPYNNYSFQIIMVNKDAYDTGSYSVSICYENNEARQAVKMLTVSGGSIESINITWVLDNANYAGPGQYYIVFRIQEDFGNNRSEIIESDEALITITE